MLVEAGGEVVTKEELTRQIWGGALVEESNVAKCVTALRKALDPAPDGGSYFETVARVGYRLAVAVAEVDDSGELPALVAAKAETEPAPARRISPVVLAGGLAALALVVAGGIFTYRQIERQRQVEDLISDGLRLTRRNDPDDAAKAAELFRQAIGKWPGYPPLQAAMAEHAARRGKLTFDSAIALREAVRRDPNCGQCQATAGYVLMTRAWKWEEAGAHLKRAIELGGRDLPQWRRWQAEWLAVHGRFPEALEQAEIATRAEPASAYGYTIQATIHYLAGRYPEAQRLAENAIALDSYYTSAHYWNFRSAMQTGDDYAAMMARARFITGWRKPQEPEFYKVHRPALALYEQGGRRAVAKDWINEVSTGPALEVQRYARAVWFMWIGEQEKALVELEAGVKSKPYHMIFTAVDPAFAPLRDELRFQEVVRQVGLQPALTRAAR
jgi:tetratricopeptide (TPR) repeat protein